MTQESAVYSCGSQHINNMQTFRRHDTRVSCLIAVPTNCGSQHMSVYPGAGGQHTECAVVWHTA